MEFVNGRFEVETKDGKKNVIEIGDSITLEISYGTIRMTISQDEIVDLHYARQIKKKPNKVS